MAAHKSFSWNGDGLSKVSVFCRGQKAKGQRKLLSGRVNEGDAFFLSIEEFLGQPAIGYGSDAVGIVLEDRAAVARGLGEADRPRDDGIIDDLLKVIANFLFNGGIQVGAAIKHRQQ